MATKKTHRGGARPGAGRKPLPQDEKPHPRTYRATDPEYAEIQRRAEEAGLASAEYVRRRALGLRTPQTDR
jgi:hypothetical protein